MYQFTVPGNMVVNNDLQVTQAGGTRSLQVRFLNWYMSKLLVAAQNDRRVAMAFLRVSNLMASPQSLMHPIIALRVLYSFVAKLLAIDANPNLSAN